MFLLQAHFQVFFSYLDKQCSSFNSLAFDQTDHLSAISFQQQYQGTYRSFQPFWFVLHCFDTLQIHHLDNQAVPYFLFSDAQLCEDETVQTLRIASYHPNNTDSIYYLISPQIYQSIYACFSSYYLIIISNQQNKTSIIIIIQDNLNKHTNMQITSNIIQSSPINQNYNSSLIEQQNIQNLSNHTHNITEPPFNQQEQKQLNQNKENYQSCYLEDKSIIDHCLEEPTATESKYIEPNIQRSVVNGLHSSRKSQGQKTKRQDNTKSQNIRHSRLREMEQQKKTILKQLKLLDEEILVIKSTSNSKSKQKLISEQQMLKKAKKLVKYYKNQKILVQQKKKKQTEKTLMQFKQEQEQFRKHHTKEIKKIRQQKRRVIEIKIQQAKKRKEERTKINLESDRLIAQLIKQSQIIKQKEAIPIEIAQLQEKKLNNFEKKQQFNIKQIEQHQRKYLEFKQQSKEHSNSRKGVSLSYPIPKFQKNIWAERLQKQDLKRQQQLRLRQLNKRLYLDKRIKYSEIVKNIFLPKRKEINKLRQQKCTSRTPQLINNSKNSNLPAISESEKKITETFQMKKYRQNRRICSSPNSLKRQSYKRNLTEKSPEEKEEEKIRIARLLELRKITNQRLKKLQNKSIDLTPIQKPKYQNYLGKIKHKKKENPKQWKKIIQNPKLSNEQKYNQMIKRAALLEQQAKFKQECTRENDQSIDLYINSIQAKLALLQKF